MKGAILGDIIGSRYEFDNYQGGMSDIVLLSNKNFITDDTICTLGIADAILNSQNFSPESVHFANSLWTTCRKYLKESDNDPCFGAMFFFKWVSQKTPRPYGSCGNGAIMRISSIPYFCDSLEKVKVLTRRATLISHNHPDSYRAAELITTIIYKILISKKFFSHDFSLQSIEELTHQYGYEIPFLDKIESDETCQGTIPICISIILNSKSFVDAMKKAIWVGGDTDTICAIVGSIAEPLFGIPFELEEKIVDYIDSETLLNIYKKFEVKKDEYSNRL